MPQCELTNMCMVIDKKNNKVLVQERIKSWPGIAFPGGHVNNGESIVESTIREVKEETGLDVKNLKLCGFTDWYNNETTERFMVFYFRTEDFSGELIEETEEGKVFWIDIDELYNLKLCDGFEKQIPVFFKDDLIEAYGEWNSKETSELRIL